MGILKTINPPALGTPRGFTNGLLAPPGWRVLFVAGQNAADPSGHVADEAFLAQFVTALDKAVAVVRAAGGGPEHIGRMTVYVTDLDAYWANRKALREIWRARMGDHYPAMALVEVTRLVDKGATVEIETTAVVPA